MRTVAGWSGSAFERAFKSLLLGSAAIGLILNITGARWSEAHAQSATAQSSQNTYNIPAQSLGTALTSFADKAGLKLIFPSSLVAGKTTAGLSGTFSKQEAISQLLVGTGLSYRFTSANTVAISDPGAAGNDAAATVEGAVALDTIDVTGAGGAALRGSGWTQSPDEIYETPASVANINAGTITSFGNDLNSSLRSVAGVATYQDVAQPGIAVNIRGMEGFGRVTSTIDGVRQNYRFVAHGPAGYTYVEPSLLAGVDITKGAITTSGGAGTLAGAVNYRTLSIDDVLNSGEKAGAQVTTVFGGNQHDDMSVTKAGGMRFDLPGAPNGASIFGAVNMTSAGAYEDGDGNVVTNSWRDVKSGLVKGTFAPNNEHRLELGGIYYTTDFAANFYNQTITNKTLTAKYAYTPDNSLIDLRVNGYFNETTSEWFGGASTDHDGRVMTDKATGFSASNTSRWAFGSSGLKLDYGLEYYRDEFSGNTDTDSNPDGDSSIGGAFLQATLSAGMFEFIPGLRYDVYNLKSSGTTGNVPDNYWTVQDSVSGTSTSTLTRPSNAQWNNPARYTITELPFDAPWRGDFNVDETRSELSPKFTIAAKPLDWLQIYGTWENSFRPPSINEMFFGGDHGGGVTASFLPNPSLKPETAQGWEVGANILKNGLITTDDSLRVKAAVYSKDVDDFIVAKCVVNASICWFANAPGESRLSGFELDASYDVGWGFAGLSYSKNESDLQFGDGIGGMGEPSRLPDDYTTLTAGIRLLDRKLTLGGRMNDVSKGTLIEGGGWETAAYKTYDLFLNFKPSDRLNLFANVTNLTNEQFIPALSQDNGPGRRIFGGATVKFGEGPLFGDIGASSFGGIFGQTATETAGESKTDWSGLNVGLAGVYSWVDQNTDKLLAPSLASPTSTFDLPVQDMRGYAGEGHAGYDFQFSNGIVLGVGGAYSFGGDIRLDEKVVYAGTLINGRDTRGFVDIGTQMDWSASVRGKLGYAVGSYLPYVTGGVSWASYSHDFTFSDARGDAAPLNSVPPTIKSEGQNYFGWTIGAGLEKAITERLSVWTEYSFTDLGSETFDWKQQARPGGAYTRDGEYAIDLKKHDLKVGVSYRF